MKTSDFRSLYKSALFLKQPETSQQGNDHQVKLFEVKISKNTNQKKKSIKRLKNLQIQIDDYVPEEKQIVLEESSRFYAPEHSKYELPIDSPNIDSKII